MPHIFPRSAAAFLLIAALSACAPATPLPATATRTLEPTASLTEPPPTPSRTPTPSLTPTLTLVPTRVPITLANSDTLTHLSISIPESAFDVGWLPDSSGLILAYPHNLAHLTLFPARDLVPVSALQNCTRILVTSDTDIIASCETQVVIIDPISAGFRILADHKPTAFALSTDGTLLAHGSNEGRISLIEIASGTPLAELSMTGAVRSLAFSSDGTLLAAASDLSGVWLWDVAAGRSLNALPSGGLDNWLMFSPDNTVLIGQFPSAIRVWFVVSGGVLRTFKTPAAIRAMALHPSGELLAASDVDNTLYLINVFTGDVTYSQPLDGGAFPVRWSPDGTALAALGINADILHLWTLP